MLATFVDNAPTLNLVLGSNQNVGIAVNSGAYFLTLSTGTWSGSNDTNAFGTGSILLIVSMAAFTSGIHITDTGSTGGDGVTFNNNQASVYSNTFNIALTNSALTNGLSFNGTGTFSGSAALIAAVNGSISVNSGATLSMGAGSLSLAATGSNVALTASGDVLSQGGSISLQATGDVVVSSDVTIDSDTAPLTLAADVTAAGAGDDGTGTLSIGSGATVTTTGAISLRGADVNIDTSGDAALVGASRPSTSQIAMLTGPVDNPIALAFDSSGNLYVANLGDDDGTTVTKFAPGTTTASATLMGLDAPRALDFDSNGNLFVVNQSANTVSKFAPGATTASATLTGLSVPDALAIDSSGNVYVANQGSNTVAKFAPGSLTPTAILTGLTQPNALVFDSSGNLYAANGNNKNTVSKFAPGATTATATLTGLNGPDALAIDSSGNLLVANGGGTTVSKFAPGATTANVTLAGVSSPDSLAFDSGGNLFVANDNNSVDKFAPGATTVGAVLPDLIFPQALAFDSSGNLFVANDNNSVDKFAPGATTAVVSITGFSNPDALAFDSSGDLYVANYDNGTVNEFAPGATSPTATLSGFVAADALAVDSSGDLYVANEFGSLTFMKFAPGASTPSVALSAVHPTALAFDSSGNLYVANGDEGGTTIDKYAPGATTASATLTGVNAPFAMTLDSSGDLYVVNAGNNTVSKFAPGATTASATLIGLNNPHGLVLDSSGNLYVSNYGNDTVSKFAPGATTAGTTLAGLDLPYALAIDSSGNLYVANNGDSSTVTRFAAGATVADAVYQPGQFSEPNALAFDPSGNLYVAGLETVTKFPAYVISPAASAVTIQSSVESRPMLVGGSNSSPVAGINLTSAELAQIVTTSLGSLTIGDTLQSGNIRFSAATPATTAGSALNVIQSTTASGQIILDDAAGSATGLNGNGGKITLTPGTAGIQSTLYATGLPLATRGFTVSGESLNLALGFVPTLGTQFMSINNTATPAGSNLISGTFSNLPQGGTYTASYLGASYNFQANYQGGDGNDLVLTETLGPDQLVITSQSLTTGAGSGFGLTVEAEDGLGNLDTTFTGAVTVALGNNPGGSVLGGILTANAVGGIATFSGLELNKVGSGYTLAVNSSTLVSATSGAISVTPGAATMWVITAEPPATVTSGIGFGFSVTAEDSNGNTATGFSGSVTVGLASDPTGSTLGGTLSAATTGGTATFSGLTLKVASGGYALNVAGGTLTAATSSPISVVAGTATQLLIASQPPSTVASGSGFGFTVVAEDANGNLAQGFAGNETVSLASNPSGGSLGGTVRVAASGGIATFSGLNLRTLGSGYTLAVQSGSLAAATSSAINVTAGAATQLVITSQPASTVTAGNGLRFTVTAEDSQGNVATGFSGSETIALASNPAGGSLGGVLTVTATNGVAVFSDVILNKAGGGYTLAVGSGTLAAATSSSISVTPGVATQLVISAQPPATVMAGNGFALSVVAEDAEGNVATGFTGSVTAALAANPGGSTLGGTLTVNAVAGVASFSGLSLDMSSTGYTLQLSAGGLTSAVSSSITVPTVIMITGTTNSNDDVSVTFTGSGQFSVTSGGTTTTYSTTNFNQVMYNAPTDGTFSKFVFDDPIDPLTANQSLGTTTISEGGFQFQAKGVTNLYLYGGPESSATVNVDNGGPSSSNFFVVDTKDDYSYIADPGTQAYSELSGFGSETVTGSAGTTYAYIYSTSNAKTVASPTQTTFTVGSVTSTLSNFPQVYVVGAADGTDSITLDSSGGTFVSSPGFSYVGGTSSGASFLLGAIYAAHVTAQASSGGKDTAVFYSYPNDTFTGALGTSSLAGSATNVTGASVNFVSQALGFSGVSVFESGSGSDVADLTSPGNGSFFGTSTASTLSVGTSTITVSTYFLNNAQQLVAVPGQIVVTGNHDGTDTATIYDAPGNNALTASGSTATLSTSLGSLSINKFGSVTANKENGSSDAVHQDAIDFALKTVGNWTNA